MNTVARVLLITVLSASIAACEKWSWPPYEKSARNLFAENQELFEEIRQNMSADNLDEVDWAHARGRATYYCEGPSCPRIIDEHDEQLQAKYSRLIEDRSAITYTLRDNEFIVRLTIPPTQGGNFYFGFVRSESGASIPHCDERKARLPHCGMCYEDLDPNWYMIWRWYPRDLGPDWDGSVGEGLPTPEEIDEQYEKALDECLKAGRDEMELDSGTE